MADNLLDALQELSSVAVAAAAQASVSGGAGAGAGAGAAGGNDAGEASAGVDDVLARARSIMRQILANRTAPNPCHLHNLAFIVEQEESRYEQQVGHPFTNNSRSSHAIGRLVNIIRDDDVFFNLVSTKLFESVHTTRVRAAAARLLYACVSCWMYPHDFEEAVLNRIKEWVIEDIQNEGSSHSSAKGIKNEGSLDDGSTDREILRTYSTGLLAVALAGSGDVVEDVLTTGMVSKLMHYLRLHVLGDVGIETTPGADSKPAAGVYGPHVRDEARGRVRPPLDVSQLGEGRLPDRAGIEKLTDGELLVEPLTELPLDAKGKRVDIEEEKFEDRDILEGVTGLEVSEVNLGTYDASEDAGDWITEEKRRKRDRRECKNRGTEWYGPARVHRDDDIEESGRAEPSRRRGDFRVGAAGRGRGKSRPGDVLVEGSVGHVQQLSPGGRAGSQVRRVSMDRSSWSDSVKGTEVERDFDAKARRETCNFNEHNSRSLVIGSLDLSAVVRDASNAAENEARAAKAPLEAVQAAGDAAAELVRVAATEALGESNDVEAALAAAKAAAESVADAARATESRDQSDSTDTTIESPFVDKQTNDHSCDLDIQGVECKVDVEVLTFLRQRFCVQCLEKMGEYLEVLGPVLQERGVDVCLALLQRRPKDSMSVKDLGMLSDVLKLICALAAHRKFAALFVDRGGVQQLLETPRVPQTLTGISLCLFAIASLQNVMERVCAFPAALVHEIVALALQLLESSQDPARRNAALFFGASFVFRVILDAFDTQDGLRKILNVLGNAALLRAGGGSNAGTSSIISAGSRSDRGSAAEVLTSSGKQIAYHTCVALRQYFRAHLVLLVDSLRPFKGHRSGSRAAANPRAVYRAVDLSNETNESLITQLQQDRKIGPAFVRSRWTALETFMSYGGHVILLELTQAAPGERYLNDIAQHALGVLQIVTLMPYTRRVVAGATLFNERSGMSVILEAGSGAAFGDPEVIQAALLVLINLVCPPPSLCSRPLPLLNTSGNQGPPAPGMGPNGAVDGRERAGKELVMLVAGKGADTTTPAVVGDRRISLGPGAGGSGIAAYMEQGYRYAREAVRSNNGIRVLLHLLYPRTVFPPAALDRIRALACRVLLGLARDDTIAHILTKLQVGKIMSELLRDGSAGRHASSSLGGEHGRWQAELSRVAMDLIAIVTNAGRASTVAASEAAAPTLRRIERAAIAAATPISYHSRELLQLIHEHLSACGLTDSANTLMKEAQLTPLPSLLPPVTPLDQGGIPDEVSGHLQWPSGRIPGGFLNELPKQLAREEEAVVNSGITSTSERKKIPGFSAALIGSSKAAMTMTTSAKKVQMGKDNRSGGRGSDSQEANHIASTAKHNSTDLENLFKTPARGLATKRKATDRDHLTMSPSKRVALAESTLSPSSFFTPVQSRLKGSFPLECSYSASMPALGPPELPPRSVTFGTSEKAEGSSHGTEQLATQSFCNQNQVQVPNFSTSLGLLSETRAFSSDRATLDSLVVQYLKHQHRQCPAPITTLPPLSLLHPHVCPEPSRALDAPMNTAGRLAFREIGPPFGGVHGRKRDRHFVYSRFRPWRTCRDETALLTTTTFLGRGACFAAGSHVGDVRIFDPNTGNILEIQPCHTSPITSLQCASQERSGGVEVTRSQPTHLLLSSTAYDARLWDSSALGNGPLHTFDGCKGARFNHSGSRLGAVGIEASHKEVLLYDVASGRLEQRLSDGGVGHPRSHSQAFVHFSPSDILVLYSGVLWDHRIPKAVHKFDQFTDYGGGGFHPGGNEVIINSEVWDLRSHKLLRSVPSLDQTAINFNATSDVMYAYLRRTGDDIMGALNAKRARHELFSAFRTMDAVDYSEIATTPVDRCVLDLATEASDTLLAVVGLESNDELAAVVRLYEVGRRRPTDDDSDLDDVGDSEEEEESDPEDDEDGDVHDDGDTDMDLGSNDDEDGSADEDEDGSADEDEDDEDAFGDTAYEDGGDDGSGGRIVFLSDGEDVNSSDNESGGEFDGFDRMLQGIL